MSKGVLIGLMCLALANSEIVPFNNDAIEKIFQKKQPALFLFSDDNEASTAAETAFKQYDQTNPEGVILTQSDSKDGFGLYDRLTEYLGVDPKAAPQVLFLGSKSQKYRFDHTEITKQNLGDFVTRVVDGKVEEFLKSSPIPQTNDEPVKVLVGKTFKQMVLDSDKEVLVKFYAPWCGHCKTLAPHYDEAAKRLANNPNILIAKIDSTENEVAGIDIQGFPTLKFFGKDKSVGPIQYSGDRNADGIVQWLKEHTEYQWVDEVAQEKNEQSDENETPEVKPQEL